MNLMLLSVCVCSCAIAAAMAETISDGSAPTVQAALDGNTDVIHEENDRPTRQLSLLGLGNRVLSSIGGNRRQYDHHHSHGDDYHYNPHHSHYDDHYHGHHHDHYDRDHYHGHYHHYDDHHDNYHHHHRHF